ncbi:MAG: GspH/FimT family protein [bacterium]|nr:GspH/FimT family protein [bacterium]
MKEQHGFTVLELMVVVAIVVTVLAITTLSFMRMNQKYRVESSIKEIYSTLMQARNDATLTNIPSRVRVSAQEISVLRDTNEDGDTDGQGENVSRQYAPFILTGTGDIVFNRRGFAAVNRIIRITNYPDKVNPAMDCLVVSATRINMGKWDGTNCVQR